MSIKDAIPIVLLLRFLLHNSAKAMQIISRVVERVVIVSASQLLNLSFDSVLIQFDMFGAPVDLKACLIKSLL